MKRYIRASYDPSMPSWLKNEAGKDALEKLTSYVAISEAKFYPTPQEGSIPIYLLDDTYKESRSWGETYKTPAGQYVYVPDIPYSYWSRFLSTGERFRSLDTVAKSRLQQHIIDTVYMVAPLRSSIRNERGEYVDPRSNIEYHNGNRRFKYAGQYPEYEGYRNEDGQWVKPTAPTSYSDKGRNGRDKSGYEIPRPEDLYRRLYARFPDRLKGRINEAKAVLDEYYDKLEEAKNTYFSKYDIRKGKSPKYYGNAYEAPVYKLQDAIEYYGMMYEAFDGCIEDDGSVNPAKLAEFMKGTSWDGMQNCIEYIDKDLESFYKRI